MNNDGTLLLGVVAYDPKVVTIWNGFREYFGSRGLDFDYILFSNYERQVEALLAGHIHVAWNSPLAWLQTKRLAENNGQQAEVLAMRDSDCDLTSVVIVRDESEIGSLADLKGKRVAVGAKDSPQATLIPLETLAQAGLQPDHDFKVMAHDKLVGLHGDHIGGERDAVFSILSGAADATCMLEANLTLFHKDGTLSPGTTRVLARTQAFDHCNFTVLNGVPAEPVKRFRELLLSMRYDDPQVRPLLDMEGLKAWRPGRTSGYGVLAEAVARFSTLDEFVKHAGEMCQ